MDIEIIRRISLARHLFELGSGSLRSKNDLHLFAAVNLIQDAVEAFLIALADHIKVAFDQNTKFERYFVLIDEKITPKALPFKARLLRLNRVRVDSKHHGIQPARDECERLAVSAREFMDETSSDFFGVPFTTISAIDLLEQTESKQHLTDAKVAIEAKDFEACVIHCRKAVYSEIERKYDISAFKDGEPIGLLAAASSAPYYAKNKDYISRNVCDPTDYIVLDHSEVDRELLTQGVDPTDFWNIWRLTPKVYKTGDGSWFVRHEFSKLDPDTLGEKAEYIFSTTLDIVLAIHTNRRAVRWQDHGKYYVELTREGVPVFKKADRTSQIESTVPAEVTRLSADYSIAGFNDEGPYWHVTQRVDGKFILGFIHNDDIK